MQHNKWPFTSLLPVFVITTGLAACSAEHANHEQPDGTSARIAELMNDDTRGGFSRIENTREFKFPEDHGSHGDFKNERWHFSGNLESLDGERFGYQFSIHRIGLVADVNNRRGGNGAGKSEKHSAWRTGNIFLANFSITDVEDEHFYQSEKLARETLGLAKVSINSNSNTGTSGLEFTIDNWKIRSTSDDIFPIHIFALDKDLVIDLTVNPAKGIKLNGYYGKSQKGRDDGNASLYYSITRLKTSGSMAMNGKTISLKGDSWFDHEWGTAIRGSQIAGIDWYAFQFSDGRDLSFYRLRNIDNETSMLSRGQMVFEDGHQENINFNEIDFHASNHWTSPASGVIYPTSWDIRIPKYRLNLHITPLLQHQEIIQAQTYWEGATRFAGYQNGTQAALSTVNGYGYVRLAGYKKELSEKE